MVFLRACSFGLHLYQNKSTPRPYIMLSGPDSPRVISEAWLMIAMWQYGFRIFFNTVFFCKMQMVRMHHGFRALFTFAGGPSQAFEV